ncbi:hypothetical protein P4O66_007712 [Electrophorus voltai]|uniref:ribonuclease H n=1 Tax=Electrophorus voltai TaxID=2609070 RepID=A0AAD9E1Y8_9TELE|nr:hypothetical protein P4O66_007712 [Electrophorus voltai]
MYTSAGQFIYICEQKGEGFWRQFTDRLNASKEHRDSRRDTPTPGHVPSPLMKVLFHPGVGFTLSPSRKNGRWGSTSRRLYDKVTFDPLHVRHPRVLFFVKKKDGGLSPCVDYRGLNELLVQYPYPLPLVPAALEQLREAQLFTKLDLRSVYNLIRIREAVEWKTAFSTSSGHYEYLRWCEKAYINEVLREFLGRSVVAYIDDILIYSSSLDQHVHDVRTVLCTLLQNHLYCKLVKCEFHHKVVSFFICKGSQPDAEKPFVVEVDSSDVGVVAVLSQHKGQVGQIKPIAYFSKKLSPAERNYGVGDREFLVMKLAFEEWRHWLEGV